MKRRNGRNHGRRLLALMMALILCFSLLNVTALALEDDEARVPVCGLEESDGHVHTQECYELICGLEESEGHQHTEACETLVVDELTCGLEESEGHTHSDACYDEEGNLICTLEESEGHTHGTECYTSTTTYLCGLKESEGHTHTTECYGTEPVCGMEEGEGAHHHTDECYGSEIATTSLDEEVEVEGTGTLTCDGNNIEEGNVTLKDGGHNGGHNVIVTGTWHGTITYNGTGTMTIIGGGTIDATGKGKSAITVQNGATVILDGPTVTGGVGTEITHKGLETRNNGKFNVGGGIYVESGTFELKNGIIKENTAQRGGGIFVNQGASLVMEGGAVSNNETVSKDNENGWNYAGEGGGIFVWGTATISGGAIINNKCNSTSDLGGGGLYVNNKGKATLINAIVTDNTAEGFGGGIAGCCHGEMAMVDVNGVALYNNKALGEQCTLGKESGTANVTDQYKQAKAAGITGANSMDFYTAGSCIVSNYMAGGGSANYTIRFKNSSGNGETKYLSDTEVVKYESTNVALTAYPDDVSVEKIPTDGVLISGNYSSVHGGGIGCNGGLYFGSFENQKVNMDVLELNLTATKVLYGGEIEAGQFEFELLYNDEKTVVARAKNDANGNISFNLNEFAEISEHIVKDENNNDYITFHLKERIPSDVDKDPSIIYDESVYKIVVKLQKLSEVTGEETLTHLGSNKEAGSFQNITVTYTLTTYKEDSKTVYSRTVDENGEVVWEPLTDQNIVFVNQDTGSLTITKSVVGGGDEAATKEYKFTVTGPDNYSKEVTITGSGSVTLDNLVPGEYTVTEQNADIDGYTLEVTGGGENNSVTIEAGGTEEVTVTNTYTQKLGSLKITKVVSGGGDTAANKTYTFTVTGQGEYTHPVTITGNGSATITDLVPGTYTVTEDKDDAEIDGYTLEVTGDGSTATVVAEDTVEATITNTYTQKLGSLKITKTVTGESDEAKTKTYTFNVTGPNDYSEEVTVPAGKTVTIEKLPIGEYTVTEKKDGTEIEGYTLNVTGEGTATVTAEDTATVTVTNTYTQKTGSLTINKKVVGGGDTAAEKTYTFLVTNTSGYSETVTITGNGSKTLENLVPGTYTVTEQGADIDGYTLEVTGDTTATVEYDKTAEVEITNTYTQKLGSLTVTKTVVGGGETAANKTYTFTVTGPNGYSETVTITGNGSETIENLPIGEYTVTEVREGTEIAGYTLNVTGEGTATVTENGSVGVTITNTYTQQLGGLTVTKTVVGGGDEAANKEYTFTVTGPNYSNTVSVTGNGSATLTNLVPGTYTVTEASAEIEGYTLEVTGNGATATVAYDAAPNVTITNTYTEVPKTSVTVNKTWVGDDENVRPTSITVNLLKDGAVADSVTLNAENGWAHTWGDLDVATYTVAEVNVPENYTATVTGSGTSFTITNTYTQPEPETIEIPVTKIWHNADGSATTQNLPESITVNLLNNGEVVDTATLTADGGWSHTFTGLDAEGSYTVQEVTVAGWTTSVEGYTITNTRSVATTSLTVNKVWHNASGADVTAAQTGSVEVTLTRNNVATDMTATLNAENGWSYTFTNLPATDENGNAYTYGAVETALEGWNAGYTTNADGSVTITNTRVPISVSVSKIWQGGTAANLPESLTVNLLRDGEVVGTTTLSAANNWSHTWGNLDPDGTYSVQEVPVAGWTLTSTTGNSSDGFVLTNTRDTRSLTVSKTWQNANGSAATTNLPESITVNLLSNGEVIDTVTLSAANNWSHTFTGLDIDATYSVEEVPVAGWTVNVSTSENGYTITNTRDLISIPVTKIWHNADGSATTMNLPESITVNLLNNGEVVDTATLTADGGWSHTFTGLDAEGSYTVQEVAVSGWTTSVDGYTITNTRELPVIPNQPNEPEQPDQPTEIPDEGTPLSEIPEVEVPLAGTPAAEEPLVELPEEEVPLANVPKTGDNSRMLLWLSLAMGSGLGLVVLGSMGKKGKKQDR